ncbi:unnamed protein product [Rotaria sordida]|uniref:Polymerase nucleotidyl transferase domain-containing protein n=1 Tax=Rotaria sordida TaxID=392033 RepID=A0A819E5Q0_9BILA|nr:unnamed protein product [Rotaria sordida]
MNKTILLSALQLDEKLVECIYVFGSHAYGTASEQRQSDYDIVMILKSNALNIHPFLKWKSVNWLTRHNWINPDFRHLFSDTSDRTCFIDLGDREAQVWIFNVPTFSMLLKTNTMFAIECIYLPTQLKWIENRKFSDEFCVDDKMLTQSIINHSRSHLFMACKNMIENLFSTENNDIKTREVIDNMSKDPIWNHTPLPTHHSLEFEDDHEKKECNEKNQ